MNKSLIILALSIIVLSGFVALSPSLFMNPMMGDMNNMDSDCIGYCLKMTPLNMHNSAPIPIVVQIFGIFIFIVLGIIYTYKFIWLEEKEFKLQQLFLFNTIFLKE
ncbi:MAG: hypothetical protein ACNFW9_04195 [Candidatus Kerfeldbacteria bacterium]